MEPQKAFVDKEFTASIKCPLCGNIKTFDVGKFKGKSHSIKVKCSCEAVFPVVIDFRKSYRKRVELAGTYSKVPPAVAWSNMQVVDISVYGMGIVPTAAHNINVGDTLRVKFSLDDEQKSLVDKNVQVVSVNKQQIGCEFVDSLLQNRILGRYLMS